jgi:hypothetical protein
VYSPDSRIPEMRIGTPVEDARRRDFTINAFYYNVNTGALEGALCDSEFYVAFVEFILHRITARSHHQRILLRLKVRFVVCEE